MTWLLRIRAWIRARLGRSAGLTAHSVAYESGACRECGGRSAVLEGRCWYCRTGNEPVTEPMVWTGD